ncbi:MAG TPA: hypothetical protein VGM03_02710, partial [Phycisphaerae bacterium]
PADGAQITTPTIDVAGRVSDMLSGFAGLAVTVNDVPAQVNIGVGTNGTFFAPAVPLMPGPNTIMASAADGVGNTTTAFITVTRVTIPPDAAQIQVVSGNGQSVPVLFALPAPLVVQVTNLQGLALEGKLVNFHVTRSDGRLAANAAPPVGEGAMMLQAFSDANGEARAFWRLGTDAGAGNNRVEVTSTDVIGTTLFCASALAGAPLKLNVGTGNNQEGEAGAPAAEPLVVWANDSCNPVADLPIAFIVRAGGGKVNGLDEVTVVTATTGHAGVNFTYGPDTGNNAVVATFAGNPTTAARFVLHGVKRDPLQPTRLTGIVLDNGEQPLRNATCTLTIPSDGINAVALTDIDGQFAFDDLSVSGAAKLRVDGSTVDHVGGANGMDVPANSYPAVPFKLVLVPNATNTLPSPALLPRLNPNNTRTYSTTQDTELTIEGIAGLKMIVKAGSMTLDQNGTLVPAPDGTPISLNQVHHDDVPMPMTDGAAPPFAWTLKPAGAHFNPPVKVEYPNMSGLPAGSIANFLSFNHDIGKFQIVASGSVTEDGMKIITDPGSGLTIAGWGCNCPPYSVTGQCCHSEGPEGGGFDCCVDPCPPCQEGCDGECIPIICIECSTCVNGECVSTCGACETCGDNGVCESVCTMCTQCINGACIPDGTPCGTGCCPSGTECCGDGDACCGGCTTCQNGSCVSVCPDCTECVDGVCIPFGTVCGTGCCGSPDSVCCPGGCAPDGAMCCGDAFCPPVSNPGLTQCCNGMCVPPTDSCCFGGSCPSSTPVCCPPGGTLTHCCGPNLECCGETCCCLPGKCCVGPLGCTCCTGNEQCTNGECIAPP